MGNPKVFEFAKEIGMTPLALMDKIREWHLPVKSHMAELDPDVLEQIKVRLSGRPMVGTDGSRAKKVAIKKTVAKKVAPVVEAESASLGSNKTTVVRRKVKEIEEQEVLTKPVVQVITEEVSVPAKAAKLETSVSEVQIKEVESSKISLDKKDIVAPQEEPRMDVAAKVIKTESEVLVKEVLASAKTVPLAKPLEPATTPTVNETPVSVKVAAPVTSVAKSTEPISVQSPTPIVGAAKIIGKEAVIQTQSPQEAVSAPVLAPASEEIKVPSRKKEVIVGTSGVASSTTPAAGVGRKNIIGRMDLSRVAQQPRGHAPGGAPRFGAGGNRDSGGFQGSGDRQGTGGGFGAGTGPGGAPRPGGFSSPTRSSGRNIRTGFVAQTVPPPEFIPPEEADGGIRKTKDYDKKTKKLTGGGLTKTEKEQEEEQTFNPVEFRKREMVFQPKKKKGMLNRVSLHTQLTKPKASKRVLKINSTMKLSALADEMGVKVPQLTKILISNGVMATPNTELDFDTIALIVPEFGFEASNVYRTADEVAIQTAFGDLTFEPVERPPVVTVMGHVDHGKTSLLDAIRKTDVAGREAGGITQHIGAYSVKLEDGHLITFLDTPGHEAFTAMRARGANVTDIAVIVVAADDGMMPQTQEAISHAKAAGVPIIVAVNKMDKPGANPERIKQQLTEFEIVPEEWGGTTIFREVSALKKTGIKELLEQIRLVAEVQELKANPNRSGTGVVIEAKVEKGKGSVATILVKDGTVRVGQSIVAGSVKGRVRSLTNDRGERVNEIGPGLPAEILGLDDTPKAGDRFDIVVDDVTAEKVSLLRREQLLKSSAQPSKLSLEEIFAKVQKTDVKELPLVLKADVHGSMEAVIGMLNKLNSAEVKIKIIHSAVGGVNESDVLLAHTAKGIVIGFNTRPDVGAQSQSKRLGVDIRTYSIVYELIDDVRKAMQGLLAPTIVEKVVGRVEVRNTFTVPKIGTIAGCFVIDGKIQRSNSLRLLRDGKIIYEGKISSLKRFKDDTREVATGFECGIGIENFNDIKVGDTMEAFIKEEVARELSPSI